MKRVPNKVVYTYIFGDYFIEICEDNLWTPLEYEAWLYHKDYGIKMFMFGLSTSDVSMDEFIDLVEKNLEKEISNYEDQFCE